MSSRQAYLLTAILKLLYRRYDNTVTEGKVHLAALQPVCLHQGLMPVPML